LNNYKALGLTGAILGIAFFMLAIIIHINPTITASTSQYVATTNRALETPYYIIGLTFVTLGIAGFWLNHLKYEKKQPALSIQNTINQPVPVPQETQEYFVPPPPPPPIMTAKPEGKIEPKVEKEVHIVEKYYRYAAKCNYCGNLYDDKLSSCPKCGAIKS
jgi:hypothetical protein